MATEKGKLTVLAPASIIREVEALAKANDRSVSAEIRRALNLYLNTEREAGRA